MFENGLDPNLDPGGSRHSENAKTHQIAGLMRIRDRTFEPATTRSRKAEWRRSAIAVFCRHFVSGRQSENPGNTGSAGHVGGIVGGDVQDPSPIAGRIGITLPVLAQACTARSRASSLSR